MDYSKMKIAELRALVAERGVLNSEGLKKNELVELLQNIDKLKNKSQEAKKSEAGKDTKPERSSESKNESRRSQNGASQRPRTKHAADNKKSAVRKSEAASKTDITAKEESSVSVEAVVKKEIPANAEAVVKKEIPANAEAVVKKESTANAEVAAKKEIPAKEEITAKEEAAAKEAVITRMVYDGQEYDPRLASGDNAKGILEVMADGYGFIRSDNYMPGEKDIYISPMQIRKYGLRTGDIISGPIKKKTQPSEKFGGLLYLEKVNGMLPSSVIGRKKFDTLTPIFPDERIRLDYDRAPISLRIVDLFSPIGKGQRGMIVSPPKAGKTTLLKQVAKRINTEYPDVSLLVLLIDERPEEVTDIKESIEGRNAEVIYSTFDETPDHHKRVSEMVIERAKRLVESGKDVVILLDSITRLARAYNLTVTPSGRTLSGGLDPAALHMPKKFFGAARNMREGGSLTILATALIETGSRLDDVVFEEFKGTGNMELILDRGLSERRVFPAIDIPRSGTRRDDLLLEAEEKEALDLLHREMRGPKVDDFTEELIRLFKNTKNNKELVQYVLKTYRNRK